MDPSENIYCTNSCNLTWLSVCMYMPPPETWAPASLNVRLCLPMTWHTTQQQWRNWHRGTTNENYRVWPQRIYYVMVLFTEHVLYHEAFPWDYLSRCLGVPILSWLIICIFISSKILSISNCCHKLLSPLLYHSY